MKRNPVEVLRGYVESLEEDWCERDDAELALDELEYRRKVEDRRDRFLFANVVMREIHECGHERHWVAFHVYGLQPGPRCGAANYWIACNAALDDVKAPP